MYAKRKYSHDLPVGDVYDNTVNDPRQQYWPSLRVGDVHYVFGRPRPIRDELRSISAKSWYSRIVGQESLWMAGERLAYAYKEHCLKHGSEPTWAKAVSPNLRNFFRMDWLMSGSFDPLAIVPNRRGLDFSFAVSEGGLIHDVCAALGVFRLDDVRQLSFLHDPVMNELTEGSEVNGIGGQFDHDRYTHSLTVLATATLMGYRLRLSAYELVHLQAAAVSHDVLTSAGGDVLKFIDSEAFDEDARYPEVFQNNPEWITVRNRYGLSEEFLASIVRGEGKLGVILDLADKTSYVAHDVVAYVMENDPTQFRGFKSPASLLEIWRLQKSVGYPLCALWKYVGLQDGRVVVRSAVRLGKFLKLRALMFKHLYYNPKARYREQMLATLVIDYLYSEGILFREQLVAMRDLELERFIDRATGREGFGWALSRSDLAPSIEAFPTVDLAKARARELVASNPRTLVMFEPFPTVSDKAVQFLVRDKHGRARPFAEACPAQAEEVLAIGRDPLPVKMYVLALDGTEKLLSPEIQERLLARQRTRIGYGVTPL